MIPLSNAALDAYDALADGGVAVAPTKSRYHLGGFSAGAERDSFVSHLEHLQSYGVAVDFELLSGAAARDASPVLSDRVTSAVGLVGQRFLDPTLFVPALAESVAQRGGTLQTGANVRSIRDGKSAVELLIEQSTGPTVSRFDSVVLCPGAWLSSLARRFGVGVGVRAGRGHSVNAARPMLEGVDLDDLTDVWVGSRPVTSDGLPLAGPTRSPWVWCVGGRAMEGMVLGPVTARLTAESLATGRAAAELLPFSPLR